VLSHGQRDDHSKWNGLLGVLGLLPSCGNAIEANEAVEANGSSFDYARNSVRHEATVAIALRNLGFWNGPVAAGN